MWPTDEFFKYDFGRTAMSCKWTKWRGRLDYPLGVVWDQFRALRWTKWKYDTMNTKKSWDRCSVTVLGLVIYSVKYKWAFQCDSKFGIHLATQVKRCTRVNSDVINPGNHWGNNVKLSYPALILFTHYRFYLLQP